MNWLPGPSVAEERAEALSHLTTAAPATPWRHNGILLRIVFSVAAWVAVSALFQFFELLNMPKGWFTAILAIGTAELLIGRYRFFRAGVESALWLGGTFAFIFGLPSSGKLEAILVFAAAAALSGWRMRNAFFGVLAAILIVVYVCLKWQHSPVLTMSAALLIAIVAAFAMRRVWQRPSNEMLFGALAVAMPVIGYLASALMRDFSTASPNTPIALLLGGTAFVLLAVGIVWRDRILLLSATLATSLTAIELREIFDYSTEAKLIVGGAIVIAIAAILGRMLRGATRGFVVTPVRTSAYEEAMQIGGIISVAPHGSAPDSHQHSGPELADSAGPTDKSYGGGGAGGGF